MREIKFRAWDDQQKEWIADRDLYMMTNGRVYAGIWTTRQSCISNKSGYLFSTGLRDAYGKEIYEGDFIEIKNGLMMLRLLKSITVLSELDFRLEIVVDLVMGLMIRTTCV